MKAKVLGSGVHFFDGDRLATSASKSREPVETTPYSTRMVFNSALIFRLSGVVDALVTILSITQNGEASEPETLLAIETQSRLSEGSAGFLLRSPDLFHQFVVDEICAMEVRFESCSNSSTLALELDSVSSIS